MKNKELVKQYKEELKNICSKYNFKYKELSEEEICLCAKNMNEQWEKWIEFDLKKRDIQIAGNTDQCNFWFYNTRKDMTPDKINSFVGDINELFRKFGKYTKVKTLIDSEDWQEIAGIDDAYKDNLYNIYFHDIEFSEDNYIFFSIEYGEDSLDGIFRISDLVNGPDMKLVSIECTSQQDKDFVNAHWEEIEEKLCEIIKEKELEKEETI